MKKKVLSLALAIVMLVGAILTLSGCGSNDSDKKKSYSEKINYIRNQKTTIGPTFGETLDYALKDSKWSDSEKSVYITEVKVTGKDKESGDSIEFVWEVKDPGSGNYKYEFKSYKVNGEDEGVGKSSYYLRENAQKVESGK